MWQQPGLMGAPGRPPCPPGPAPRPPGWNARPEWPIQQSHYQNIPHQQVDWANLAKQWIAQKETVPGQEAVSVSLAMPIRLAIPMHENGNAQASFRPPGEQWGPWTNQWVAPGPNWNAVNAGPPPAPRAVPPHLPPHSANNEVRESFDYGHGNQAFDYKHGGDERRHPPVGSEHHAHSNHPTPEPAPFFNKPPVTEREREVPWTEPAPAEPSWEPPVSSYWDKSKAGTEGGEEDMEMDQAIEEMALDAARRKALPPWIREGLEKMEREKQKRMEREQQERQRRAAEEARLRAEEEAEAEIERERLAAIAEGRPVRPRRSRFDSDDEDSKPDANAARPRSPAELLQRKSPAPEKEAPEEIMSEEEKQAVMMTQLRQTLTELLLTVTSEELEKIADEVFIREKRRAEKAPARQLSKSIALASLTGLGLNVYSSDSEDDHGGKRSSGSDDSDDEQRLQEKIRHKREQFERKMRLMEEQERVDDERFKQNAAQQKAFLEPALSCDASKNPFESKYQSIPGIDALPDEEDEEEEEEEDGKGSPKRAKERGRRSQSNSSADTDTESRSDSDRKRHSSRSGRERSRDRHRSRDGGSRHYHGRHHRDRHRSSRRSRSRDRRRSRSREERRRHDRRGSYKHRRRSSSSSSDEGGHSRAARSSRRSSKKSKKDKRSTPEESGKKLSKPREGKKASRKRRSRSRSSRLRD